MNKLTKQKLLRVFENKWTKVMRLSVFLILVGTLQTYARVSLAQQVTLQNSKITIKKVFKELRKQTNTYFMYRNGDVNMEQKVKLNFKNASLKEVLDNVCEQAKLQYKLVDDYVLITKTKRVKSTTQQQKKHTITGKVTDENGESLPGVSVVVKGTTIGVSTDINGNYTLKFAQDKADIVFSFVGMVTQTITYKRQAVLNITLKSANKQVGEVVVTGYQKLSRERATGAFSVVSKKDLDTRITTNIVDKLEGLTPGVSLDKDNKIMIRGVSTMYGDSQPLIVVDGFPIDGDISTINPEDIDKLTVLKDAAAASVWGTRAANGVIVVTTKKGRSKKGFSIEASYYKTVDLRPSMSDMQFMNSSDRIDMELDFWKNYYGANGDFFLGIENHRFNALHELYMRRYSEKVPVNMRISDADYQTKVSELRKVNGYKQYEEELLQNGTKDQFNLSLSSNSNNNSFVGSFVYNGDKSIYNGDKSKRFIVNLSNWMNIGERIKLNLSANVVYSEQKNNALGLNFFTQYIGLAPYEKIRNENGTREQIYAMNFMFRKEHDKMGLNYNYNPLDELDANDNKLTSLSTRLQAGINIKLTDYLNYSSKFQYERNYYNTKNYKSVDNPKWRNILNDYYIDGEYVLPYGGRLDRSSSETNSWTFRNQIDFTKNFNDNKHQITAIVGNELRSYSYDYDNSQLIGYDPQLASGLAYDVLKFKTREIKNRYGYNTFYEATFPDVTIVDKRDVSFYTNLAYTFLERYSLSASYRLDQASIFGFDSSAKNNKLWSVGVSWNILEEAFIKADWIDRLILRATYGVNGNRPNPNITAYLTGVVRAGDSFGPFDQKYISLTNPENSNLRSEKVYTTNIGVDYSFFNGRVRGIFEFYEKISKDLIGPQTLNPTNGWDASMVNYAEMSNKGVELGIHILPIKNKNFIWDVGLNFSYNKNEIVSVDVEPTMNINMEKPVSNQFGSRSGVPIKGHPIGRIFAYRWGGLDKEGLPQIIDDNNKTISYKKFVWGSNMMEYMGTAIAPYYGSLSNHFKYKNIEFGINITYKLGHKMRAPVSSGLYDATMSYSPIHKSYKNYWKKPGDEKFTNVPAMRKYDLFEMWYYQTYYANADINVLDASQIRLKDINIDYNLKIPALKKVGVEKLTLRFQAKNLWYWAANDWDLDPEAYDEIDGYWGSSTSVRFSAPKTFIFGVKAEF